jgi:XRE family aerobic/anaerobic benzoate catabolism transcriptional regulator
MRGREGDLLRRLGERVREHRLRRRWTLREVSARSGLSPRFLVQLEGGRGNISVLRLAEVAGALDTTPAELLQEPSAPQSHRVTALLGLRGAGKTSVGRRVAKRLAVGFVELDRRIEELADLGLPEIFAIHGEDYYRRLEREALASVLDSASPLILATGGGIVTSPDVWSTLRGHALTIWLRARPEDHWNRVVRQGDRRPMADHPQAMADLTILLSAREPLYAAAEVVIDTSRMSVAKVVDAVAEAIESRR